MAAQARAILPAPHVPPFLKGARHAALLPVYLRRRILSRGRRPL